MKVGEFAISKHAIPGPQQEKRRLRSPAKNATRGLCLPVLRGTSARRLALHHIDAHPLFRRLPTHVNSSRASYSYFLIPSLSIRAAEHLSWRLSAAVRCLDSACRQAEAPSICGETARVLAATLTRWYVCCQLSEFCLCLRETLERVNLRQDIAARLGIFGTLFSRSLAQGEGVRCLQ